MRLTTDDGERLEAAWAHPNRARGVLTFCHPHPLHDGTMRAPLMVKITDHLVRLGIAVLRFNFRGVGESTGLHDGGRAELADVSAATAEASGLHPELPHGLAGWSFGAATSLNWLAETGSDLPWAGIAPPVRSERTPALPPPDRLSGGGSKGFILGERDQFTTVDELRSYADSLGAQLRVIGADHFFYGQERRVADMVYELIFGD